MSASPLSRLALFARRRYRAVFWGFALAVAASLLLMTQLAFDTDMLNLLPRRDPVVASYLQTLDDFGANTFLLVAVRLPEGAVLEPYEALVDRLAGELRAIPDLKNVEHRIGDPQELLATFFPKAILFLDDAGRRELAARLTDAGLRAHVSELRRQLLTPQGMAVKELAKLDPLGLATIFLGRLNASRGSLNVDWTSGYYLSRDHRLLLILAEPVRPPQDIRFDRRLAVEADAAVAKALAGWKEIAGPDGPRAPEVVVGGPYLTAQGDEALIRRDMMVNIATSALGVFLLFLFAFRRPGALLYAFVPLLSGLVLTFGFSALAMGTLSSATSIVAALLIGLGIDFVIVSYGRYVELRRGGADLETALAEMGGACGAAVAAGAVTTAATFYAFTFTKFLGLRQTGLLTGTGILFCALAVLLLLPAMLAWSADRGARRRSEPKLYLHSFGTQGLTAFCMRRPGVALAAGLAVTLALSVAATGIQFDESMKTMRPRGNRGIDVAVEVGQHFGSGFDYMIVELAGKTPEEVIDRSAQVARAAQGLISRGVLYGYSGVTSLIPPREQQERALAWLAGARRSGVLDLGRIRATFERALAEQGMRPAPFEPGLELFARAVNLSGPIGLADFAGSKQTRLLLDRFLKRTPAGWKGAVYLYPPANRWRREAPPQVLALGRELGGGAIVSGVNVINERVRSLVLKDAWIAGLLGTAFVAIILGIDFRSVGDALLALSPLLVGMVWMVGGMALLGIQMNFINIFVTTMIIGIGTDYGIYIVHRYREVRGRGTAELERGLAETGKAVAAAAMSTLIGFGSIIFSHYPGLQSTGKVAILGSLSTSLVAVTLLPGFLAWRERRRSGARAGAEGAPERQAKRTAQ